MAGFGVHDWAFSRNIFCILRLKIEYLMLGKRFFADLLKWAGRTQRVTSSDPRIVARLHTGEGSRVMYVVNTERQDINTELNVSPSWGSVTQCRILFGDNRPTVKGGIITATILARDGLVIELL